MSETFTRLPSPVGELLLTARDGYLTGLYLPADRHGRHAAAHPGAARRDDAAFAAARRQLAEYFAGERTSFELPVAASGTPFQQCVWSELARRIGRPTAIRAVGAANGANPISIVIPCHRVVGSNGTLTGYGGGLPAKRFLLALERAGA